MAIWNDHDPFIIAEIGGNHEGDFEYAKKLTELACKSKAHSVKYQIYTGDSLVSPVESPQRNKHFKKFQLSQEQYLEMAKICESHNKDFAASVWDPTALNWIDQQLTYYKIGSGDLTAYPVLRDIAKTNKPILLSTGLATLDEVINAVGFIREQNEIYQNPENIAVLQCTSMYPIPDEDANLNAMLEIKKALNVTVGYSDHTIGTTAAETAVAMGAKIIEVHFTDTREGKEFRDHKVSFTPDEIDQLWEKSEKIRTLQGDGNKKPMKSELEADHVTSFRRAAYLNKDMKAGEVISETDIITLRPNVGTDARDWQSLVGKKLNNDKKAFEKILADELLDVE